MSEINFKANDSDKNTEEDLKGSFWIRFSVLVDYEIERMV